MPNSYCFSAQVFLDFSCGHGEFSFAVNEASEHGWQQECWKIFYETIVHFFRAQLAEEPKELYIGFLLTSYF